MPINCMFFSHLRCIFVVIGNVPLLHRCHLFTWLAASPLHSSHFYFPSSLLLQQAGAFIFAITQYVYKCHLALCFVLGHVLIFCRFHYTKKWHSHNRGLWNLSFCTLHIYFLLLDMHQPWCFDSRHKVSFNVRQPTSMRAFAHVDVILHFLFFSRFHSTKKQHVQQQVTCLKLGLFLVANEMWTNREL